MIASTIWRRPLPPRGATATVSAASSRAAPRSKARLIAIFVAIALVYGVLGLRLVDVQARDSAYYQSLGIHQRVHSVALPAERGSVFDRNGNDLAVSVARSSIWADPRVIEDPDAYAVKLAPILGVDTISLANDLGQKNRSFVYVAAQGRARRGGEGEGARPPGHRLRARDEALLPGRRSRGAAARLRRHRQQRSRGARGRPGGTARGQGRSHGGRARPARARATRR